MSDHEHSWQPNGIVTNDRVSRSPCSVWDDQLWTEKLSVMICACGATKSVRVGVTNSRRRGDDLRASRR